MSSIISVFLPADTCELIPLQRTGNNGKHWLFNVKLTLSVWNYNKTVHGDKLSVGKTTWREIIMMVSYSGLSGNNLLACPQ